MSSSAASLGCGPARPYRPGLVLGPRPEKRDADISWNARVRGWKGVPDFHAFRDLADQIERRAEVIAAVGCEEIIRIARRLRLELRLDGYTDERLSEAFALVVAAVRLELGYSLHPEQIYGGGVI